MVMAHPSHKATEWQVVPPILTALGLGLSVQAEIFFFIMLFQFLSGYGFPRKNITKKQILVFVLSLLIAVGTMILNEFKFGFRGIEGMNLGFGRRDKSCLCKISWRLYYSLS